MAEAQSEGSGGLVEISPKAANDLAAIGAYTAQQWGLEQSDRYLDFLLASMYELANNPTWGKPIRRRPGMFEKVCRWKSAYYAHRVIFETTPLGIHVIRVLHTSMSLLRHLRKP